MLQLIPSVDQVHAAQRLVADLDMTNPRERLVPDATPNPVLQRFYSFLGQRALDPTYEVRPVRLLMRVACNYWCSPQCCVACVQDVILCTHIHLLL